MIKGQSCKKPTTMIDPATHEAPECPPTQSKATVPPHRATAAPQPGVAAPASNQRTRDPVSTSTAPADETNQHGNNAANRHMLDLQRRRPQGGKRRRSRCRPLRPKSEQDSHQESPRIWGDGEVRVSRWRLQGGKRRSVVLSYVVLPSGTIKAIVKLLRAFQCLVSVS